MPDQQQPTIHAITSPNQLPGGGLYRMYQLDKPEQAQKFNVEAWLLESQIIKAFYLFVPVVVQE